MQHPHITSFHSFTNSLQRQIQNYYKCECCWSFDHDELVSKCKEIVLKLNEKLVFLMGERRKRVCQLLPSSMRFLRDKSEDMECMMNTFAYSTFRMAGSKKTAGRGFSHNLSFFRLSICFHRTAGFLL